jgi:transposase InsO family protein
MTNCENWPRTTDSRHGHKLAENWLAKMPAPARPGQLWQSDITYLETAEGWWFLAFTLDGCTRECVAHHGHDELTAELVLTTFEQARARETPPPGIGAPQRSRRRVRLRCFPRSAHRLRRHRQDEPPRQPLRQRAAESFVATLKTECFAGQIPATKAAAKLMVFDYIETFYNPRRRHSSLGYLSPRLSKNKCSPKTKTVNLNS